VAWYIARRIWRWRAVTARALYRAVSDLTGRWSVARWNGGRGERAVRNAVLLAMNGASATLAVSPPSRRAAAHITPSLLLASPRPSIPRRLPYAFWRFMQRYAVAP